MRKILLVTLLLASSHALAEWEYTEKLSSGDTCYYTENSETHEVFLALGNASPDSVFDECNNNGSKIRAIDNQKKKIKVN